MFFVKIKNVLREWWNNYKQKNRVKNDLKNSLKRKLKSLKLLEFTHKVGLDRTRITQIVNLGNFTQINLDYKNGKKPSELAEYYGFDIITTWYIILGRMDDLDGLNY